MEDHLVTGPVPTPATIGHVGMVVRDLDAAMEGFWRNSGIGPWKVYVNSAPPLTCIYHGRPASYQVRVAIAKSGSILLELIQYLAGDSIHRDFVESGREGVEHLGIYVPDLDAALQTYLDNGVRVLQAADGMGIKGDGRYAYLDTEPTVGTILELVQESSSGRLPPERIYPEPSTQNPQTPDG